MLAPPTENHYLVRVPKKGKTGLSWRDVWTEPLPLQKGEIIVEPIDAIRLEKIKRRIPYRQGVWEVDYFYFLFRLEVRNIDKRFTFYYNIDENDISKRRYKNEDYNKNQ